jgi:transcriptional antiterminator RfaH
MDSFKTGWYLLYTRPNREMKISYCLKKNNIQYFLPVIRKISQWNRRKKVIEMPLFPSYIFVKLTGMADYFKTCNNEGVCGFVKSRKTLVWISEHLINQVRIAVENSESVYVSAGYFHLGEPVEVKDGILSGLSGELVQYNGKSKILLRMNMMNRSILVDLPEENRLNVSGA